MALLSRQTGAASGAFRIASLRAMRSACIALATCALCVACALLASGCAQGDSSGAGGESSATGSAAGQLSDAASAAGSSSSADGSNAPSSEGAPGGSGESSASSAEGNDASDQAQAAFEDDGAEPDLEVLDSLIGRELSLALIEKAQTDPDCRWIAAHPEELASNGEAVQAKLLRLAAEEDAAIGYVRDYAASYPAEEETTKKQVKLRAEERVGETNASSTFSISPGREVDEAGNRPEVVSGRQNVPLLYQWDQRWGYTVYSSAAFGLTGCGPTSFAMVYQAITGNDDYSPYDMGVLANDMGYMAEFEGTDATFFFAASDMFGMRCEEIPIDKASLEEAFDRGCVVIANVGTGYFSRGDGHFLVLPGLAADGQVVMNNPYSAVHSYQTWYVDFILNETKALFAFSEAEEGEEEFVEEFVEEEYW